MDVESLAKQLILKGMTEEQQKSILESIKSTMVQARTVQKQRVGENVQVVVQALKKLENDIRDRYDELGNKIEQRVASIKDGQDGRNGVDGRAGKDGRPGRDGAVGPRGANGLDGRNGVDGVDGVSVTNAYIDFDGSLIINLSSGQALNVGEVVAPDLAEKIKVITNGGGTSQVVIDTLESLQSQIDALEAQVALLTSLTYKGTWDASTNVPALASSTGVKGDYYIVSVAGTTNLNGITDWQPGDWVIFNGTVWQKIDQSWATAGINDNITSMIGLTGGISSPAFVQFDTTATPTQAVGRLQWDAGEGTLQFGLGGGNVNLQVGMENVALVKNDDTVTLTDGMVVYVSGANGANLLAKRALATSDGLSATTLGVVTEAIAPNGHGYVTTFGNVNGLNTTAFTAGDVLYLSPTTPGLLTNVKPVAPDHMVTIAVCTKVSAGNGQIFVRVDNGYELNELHNVLIGTAASGNTLIYDAVVGVWKNANLTDGTGISITEGAGSITVTNTAPDQTVSLTAGAGISATGTYPNFTVTNTAPDQTVSLTAGTGISTSGTYPNFTVTNTAPDQTVSLTGSGATTVTGTYPNFTIASSGDVAGPASATDNAIARFDGTTGKLIQNSAVTIGDSGNTIIEVTDNTNAALRVTQLGTGNAILVQDSTNPDGSPFVVDATGNVGIGTTSPSYKLDVIGTYRVSGLANFDNAISLNTATLNYLYYTSALSFSQNGTGERMRIDSSGNVGIGTSSPGGYRLNVNGSYLCSSGVDLTPGASFGTQFNINGNGYTGGIALDATGMWIGQNSGSRSLIFACGNNGSTVTERARIDSSGNLMVGTTIANSARITTINLTGGASISAAVTGTSGDHIYFRTSTDTLAGFISSPSATSTTYNSLSDYRLKENIQPMTGALLKVAGLNPVTYKWKVDGSEGQGFIAHELQAVVPDCVTGDKDAVNEDGSIKPQGIDTSFLVATLTAAIQEQQQMIETLQAKVAALENK